MVAKVISGKDIKGVLNYNELKVIEGKAHLIAASGFLKEPEALSFYEKLYRFTVVNELNTRTKTNTLHISLNFDVSEKLDVEELTKIAAAYMGKIGFGEQPYLVYEHTDAAHPHVHIVTTIIRPDGKRIPIHYLGKNESESARKEIEVEFGLVKADSKVKNQLEPVRAADLQKIVYGHTETRRSISNIVRAVTRTYRYTSLPELNAVLRHFNVIADPGSEKSSMFQNKGLIYALVDQNGKRIGIPIKASSIHGKPTLSYLEKQFLLNDALRKPHRDALKGRINEVLKSPSVTTREQFISTLEAKGVSAVFRSNAEGRTYGVTFVDHNSKSVFNGSALGKEYSAAPILDRLATAANDTTASRDSIAVSRHPVFKKNESPKRESSNSNTPIQDLVTSDSFDPRSPEVTLRLGKKKRKRKQRRL